MTTLTTNNEKSVTFEKFENVVQTLKAQSPKFQKISENSAEFVIEMRGKFGWETQHVLVSKG